MRIKINPAQGVLAALIASPALAADVTTYQDWKTADVQAGLASSFALAWDDLYVKRSPSEWRNALDGLTLGAAFAVPLSRDREPGPRDGQAAGRQTCSSTLQVTAQYEPIGHWFARATAYAYLDEDRQAPWNPDFSYSFGYDDPRPFSLSLVYANYGGNRFSPDRRDDEVATRFNGGTWSLGWKLVLPRPLADPFLIDRDQTIPCTANLNLTPRFYDDRLGRDRGWKESVSLGCRAPVAAGFYLEGQVFAYPDEGDRQPWDPDFTYGFGYNGGWPGNLTVQYANYSGNRFPGSDRGVSQGRFKDGEITVSWTYSW